MNTTTGTRDRRAARVAARVDGANALADAYLGDQYGDDGDGNDQYRDDRYRDDPDGRSYRATGAVREARRATATPTKPARRPTQATAAPQPAPDYGRRRRRSPWASEVAEPAPQTAPLPIALPRAPFLLLIVGLVVVGVLGVLVLNTNINENSFRLTDLQATQAALDLQEQQLSRDLANLESPGNLRAAATRLGLVPAGTPAFINLPDGRVVGVPQPATGR